MMAFFARHPRVRNGLLLVAAAAVLWSGARLWMGAPDAVHITVTTVNTHDWTGSPTKTITFDRTIHNAVVAQRLQRDLAALPLLSPADYFAPTSCLAGWPIYDAYTLTWYHAGLPVERASGTRGAACDWWTEDGVLARRPVNVDAFYADIDTAAAAGS